jgi:hypothetical protein
MPTKEEVEDALQVMREYHDEDHEEQIQFKMDYGIFSDNVVFGIKLADNEPARGDDIDGLKEMVPPNEPDNAIDPITDIYMDAISAIYISAVEPDEEEEMSMEEAGEEIVAVDLFDTDAAVEHLKFLFSDFDDVDGDYIDACVDAYQD